MNMQQPDPAGLFDQYQQQKRQPPNNNSVISQISQRPVQQGSIPPVAPVPPVQPPSPQPNPNPQQPVNPFVALYESGVMTRSIQEAQQGNPFVQLYKSGAMTSSILSAEDEDYEKAVKDRERIEKNRLIERRMPTKTPLPEIPKAPARELDTIKEHWSRGTQALRGQELGNILNRIETAQSTPEEDAFITSQIEPNLPPELKKELQVSRLARDKYLDLQQQARQEEQTSQQFEKEAPYLTMGQIAQDPRSTQSTEQQNVMGRNVGKTLSFGYAFAPDEDRLNSDNPEEVAEERAKRQFYLQQDAEYPFTMLAGNILGTMPYMMAGTSLLRGMQVKQAGRALASGPPTARNANIIATKAAPQTVAGNVLEGTVVGAGHDILSRPEGAEDMTLTENIKARGKQVGFGAVTGAAGDVFFMKALPALAKGGAKITDVMGVFRDKSRMKKLNKLTQETTGHKDFNELLTESTELITDPDGKQVLRLKPEILDKLPDLPGETTVKEGTHGTPPPHPRSESHERFDIPEPESQTQLATGDQTTVQPPSPENQGAARPPQGEVETPFQTRTEPPVEAEVEAEVKTEAPTKHRVINNEVVEAPVDELKLSADVPQFKSGANTKGVVEPLGGSFERIGVAPVQVWVRKDGSKEVISGRHRLDLAQRSGEKTIPAQYHYESQGFGKEQAASLDAMLNIREGQGKVKDYVEYFQTTKPTKAEADADGVLARATGKRAYTIATEGSDPLIAAHRGDQLTDEAAVRIAAAAPNNERLQAVGIKAIADGKTITVAENMVKAVRTMTDTTAVKSGDMFGFDDSALIEAEALAKKAAAKQAEIQRTLSAVQGAAKNPELAAKEGVDVRDPEAVKRRIGELKEQKQAWNNWHTNPELTAELRGEAPTAKTEVKTETEPPPPQEGFDLTSQTETELTAKQKTIQNAEAASQKQQQSLETKAKADTEAKEFELGIQGSGKDVSAKQDDLLSTGTKEQPNTRTTTKSKPVNEAKPESIQGKAPTITNTPDPKAKDLKGGAYTFTYHNDIHKALKEGNLSLEEFQAAFNTLVNNKEDILKRLNTHTKAELMALSKKPYAYPKDVKKSEALEDAYNRLLKQYLFGRETRTSGEQNIMNLARNRQEYEQSVKDVVKNTTQKELDDWAKLASDYKAKKQNAATEHKARVENPQTLEDFELAVRENGKESLTTAQRAEYERLNAEAQWQAKEQQQKKEAVTEGLATDQPLEIEPITEGTHTKTGKPVYNVKVTTKLGKEKFAEAAKTARTMGGSYYKGQFSLPTREKAEQFTNWLNGQTLDHSPRTLEKQTTKATETVNKLRTMADKLEEKGNIEYNAERRTNTAKQLNQATSARAAATKKIKFAQTLRNIANGIDDGSVRFLSKLSNQTQLDELNKIQRSAIPESMVESDYNGYSMSRTVKEGVTLEDYIDRITIPEITLHRDNAIQLAEQLKGKRGYADLRKELDIKISIAKRNDKHTISLPSHSEYTAKLDTFVRNNSEAKPGWLYEDNVTTVKRLQKMGLTTDDQLRSAIRELDEIRSGKPMSQSAEHKLDGMRLKIKQNARNYNDFFPTPDDVTNRVMELADIQPGMKSLEPNAGMGHMAKKVQNAAGKEHVDLVEISPQLAEYLEAAGFGKIEQSDFLKFGKKNSYDKIVMNPPFSKDQDIDHVMHAYELLKPEGRVTAIMSNMAGIRSNKKNRAFSEWLDTVGAVVEDIEPGAFKSSFNPTSVNTKIVVIDKPKVEAKAQARTADNLPSKYSINDVDYDRAYAGSQHISHSPQKRARSIQEGYVQHMEGLEKEMSALATTPEQKAALDSELERYKAGYLKHLYAQLDADANTVSPMVAGRSNFNYKQNNKRMTAADRRREEFIEWQQRAQDSIKRELSDARTTEQVQSDKWSKVRNDIDGSFAPLYGIDNKAGRYAGFNKSAFTSSIKNKLTTLAKNGEVETVNQALDHIRQLQEGMNKPAFTNRNKIWQLGEQAQQARTAQAAPTQTTPTEEPSSYSFDGGTIVRNTEEDRLQIIFDGKPDAAMREKLKGASWRWSPTNEAWQRKLTTNAEHSAQSITGGKPLSEKQTAGNITESRTVQDTPISKSDMESMNTAIDAANWLENNAQEPAYKAIAKAIKHLLDPDTKLILGGDFDKKYPYATVQKKGEFKFITSSDGKIKRNDVVIYDKGLAESTLIHELVHAATSVTILQPKTALQKEAVSNIHQIISDIRNERLNNSKNFSVEEYGFISHAIENVDEFITYSLTNPRFQDILKKIKPASKESAFKRLTTALKKLLGFSENDGYLEKAINASSAMIEATSENASTASKRIHAERLAAKKQTPPGTTIYSAPFIPAAREAASLLHLNPGASGFGAVHGAIAADQISEEEKFSKQWWLDTFAGATAGAFAGAGGVKAAKGVPIKGRTVLGDNSWGSQSLGVIKKGWQKLPGMSPGDPDIIPLKKRQTLMKAVIEKQAEQAGEYLLKNYTPKQRGVMADLIEQRGIVAEGNLLHRQAKELDDFISYTAKKLQELEMLDGDIEPGGYLHRYYSKHLGLTGLAKSLTPKGQAISGTWSRRRGTSEVYDSKYMSQSMRDTMDRLQQLRDEHSALQKKAGDLVSTDTQARLDALKAEYKQLEKIEFREYLAPENGELKSFFLAEDEVPIIPGLKRKASTELDTLKQGSLEGMGTAPKRGSTGELVLTDRRWTIDGKEGNAGTLHRDWTKAERESWGEINDAAYRMVRGQTEVAHDLSLGTFFKTVHDQFKGTKVSDTEIEGWVQVPKTSVGKGSRLKSYGALEGKYVTPDVWKAIRNHGRNPLLTIFSSSEYLKPAVPAVKTYLSALQKWKAYKTVYNPVSHMNNSVGNLMMYNLSDYEYKHLANSFKELRKGEDSAIVGEAQRAGLFGNDWTSELKGRTQSRQIDDLLESLRTQPDIPDFEQSLDSMMKLKQWFIESSNAVKGAKGTWKTGAELAKSVGNPLINTARKPIDKAAYAAQKAYRVEDEFFKMAVYMAERERGTTPFEAVQAANRYFFDYNDLPDGMKLVRDLPLGSPFISYTYLAVPSIARTAVEKPEKILGLVAALEAVNYAGMTLNGELQEQGYWDRMDDEKTLLPTWMQGRSLFGGLNNVTVPFVESYKLGLANVLPAGNPLVGQSERSGAWPSFLSAYGAGPEGSNPIAKLTFDLSRNKDWRDMPIWMEEAPTSEKIRKATNYIYQNITPSNPLFPGSYHQQKILEGSANQVRAAKESGEEPNALIEGMVDMANATSEALGGEQFTGLDRRENEILSRDALLGSIGIKLRPVRVEQMEESKGYDVKSRANNLRKWIRSKERQYSENRLSDAQIKKNRAHAERRIREIEEQVNRISEAARM